MEYRVIRSSRKTISLQITPEGALLVRCPNRMKKADIQAFVQSKEDWIQKHLKKPGENSQPPFSQQELQELISHAKLVIQERVKYYAPIIGVSYGKITIRSQHTRWGSCSGKGNLNFNCLLMLAPRWVLDYVVVHELCHRKEMNHSARFWAQVEKVLPDYRESKKWLREKGGALIGRLP